MTLIRKRLAKGTLTDTLSIIYTAPVTSGSYTLPTGLWICNKSNSDTTVTIKIAGTEIIFEHIIEANDSLAINLKEANVLIEAGETLEAKASVIDSITYYISGVEVV
ncbi:hypothetical protein [Wukongibacter sp. M2B1]|uniref:hypothetical protein n=1 Tax=Wukongibacter sp. M2B1 TaxID=3088895 RepID=UPI003D78D663